MHSTSSGRVYGGGRVPPPHPFIRSSSVPEHYDDPYLDDDVLSSDPFHHSTPAGGGVAGGHSSSYGRSQTPFHSSPYYNGSSSSRAASGHSSSLGWRSTSYLDGLSSRGITRQLGRQLSLSTELPTVGGSERYHHLPYHNRLTHHDPYYSSSNYPDPGGRMYPPHQSKTYSTSSLGDRSPITLGRSLQLVTSGEPPQPHQPHLMRGATTGSVNTEPNGLRRTKKTVRFDSEEWTGGRGAGASSRLHPYPDCDFDLLDEGDLWMSVEDVRSGRWARWDALRQESQESQTRDSGIETGSCFNSSEDSNRGDHIHKKVKFRAEN